MRCCSSISFYAITVRIARKKKAVKQLSMQNAAATFHAECRIAGAMMMRTNHNLRFIHFPDRKRHADRPNLTVWSQIQPSQMPITPKPSG
jgi:hypothetical protein